MLFAISIYKVSSISVREHRYINQGNLHTESTTLVEYYFLASEINLRDIFGITFALRHAVRIILVS